MPQGHCKPSNGQAYIVQSSGEDSTQIPAEFAPTELPTTQPFDLETVPFDEPGVDGLGVAQQTAALERPHSFRWSIVCWGTVAIAATAIAQTASTLFTSVVAPTFSRQIERAQTRSPGVKISAMNQAQQVYFLDHGEFSEELVTLDLGIVSQDQYYDYRIQTDSKARSRRNNSAMPEQQVVVSLAIPREPGLPTLWGAIIAQGSDPSELGKAHRIADSLICKKPAPKTDWSDKLRLQLQPESVKRRNRDAVPAVPLRLECPAGFEPASFSVHA